MTLRKTVLELQQLFLDDGADNVAVNKVPAEHLEPGCTRIDLTVTGWKTSQLLGQASKLISTKFELDGGRVYWTGYSTDAAHIVIGIDTDDNKDLVVGVEEQTEEFLNSMLGERKVETSFKKFLTEARKAGVNFEEEKTKGEVVKVIATLEGHEAGQFTKVARQYHSILKALKKLEARKDELNASLKDTIGTTFDAELDKFRTRVVKSTKFAATLAKDTPKEDVKEKVEVNYEALVAGLMALLTDDLKPAAEKLLEGATKRWTPEPRSPNLTVKSLDEGITDTLAGWYKTTKEALQKLYSRFDKNLASLEKQFAKYKASKLTESVEDDWREIEDAEELYNWAMDNLPDDKFNELDSELQGLHLEDDDDHDEALHIMTDFLDKHLS